MTYRNGEARSHSVEVVRVLTHGHDFGNNCIIGPLHSKDLCELLQILSRGLANRKDGITKPAHAKTAELLVKELHAELRGKERYVFDNC
jgi:hypothetical protein